MDIASFTGVGLGISADVVLTQGSPQEVKINGQQNIIDNYSSGILIDNAYYKLAELYVNHLEQPEQAKELYEKILFNHADSIYFVEARKKFRALRGDAIN